MKTYKKQLHQYPKEFGSCPDCRKAYKKAWYEANKEHVKATKKAYYEANKEQEKANVKAWYEANKEHQKANVKAWKQANPEIFKAINKAWKQANSEQVKATKKAWRQANRAKVNANKAKRRAAKLRATPPWLTPTQLSQITSIYSVATLIQKLTKQLIHVDHIIPLQGKEVCGLHVPWNLQLLPASKNCSKGNRLQPIKG